MIAEMLSRHWWMIVLRGLFWILFGIVILTRPGITLLSLTLTFGVVTCADGVLNVANAIGGRKEHDDWWVLLLIGLTGIGVAVLTFLSPQAMALAILFYIAIWAIATGLLEIVAAVRLRRHIPGEVWLGLAGVASVIFGVLLVAQPAAGALTLLWLIATYAIAFGLMLLLLALRVRGAAKRIAAAI
jgi:uncharacterized membrane protein HdeD (DUF308 family)